MDASSVGDLTLTAAVLAFGGATVLAVWHGRAPTSICRRSVRVLLSLGAGLATCSLLVLAGALVRLDLSLVYVADAARRGATRPYRLAGLWAGMAGSLLLWAWALAVTAAVSTAVVARRNRDLATTHAAVAGGIAALTLAASRLAADPFRRLAIPAIDGGGLVPILEHGAMLVHPPLMYVGLAATLAPFAATVAALFHRRLDDDWSTLVRRGCLLAWIVLLAAMAIGAHWAYDELAWGGFWAWDPVENGVLLPWLALTAAVHAHRRARPRLQATFVVVAFVLANLGAALARSGATASVHAFAEARRVGVVLAVITALVCVVVVVAWFRGRPARAPSEQSLLRCNTIGLTAVIVAVLVGTVAPVAVGWFDGRTRVVDPVYFSRLTWPFAVGLLVALGLSSARTARARAGAAVVGAAVGMTMLMSGARWAVAVLGGVAAFAAVGALVAIVRRRTSIGAEIAHLGLGVMLVSVAAMTTGADLTVPVKAGTGFDVRGYTMDVGTFSSVRRATSADALVPVTLRRGGALVATLVPRWRVSQPGGLAVAVVARRSTITEDVQLVLARVAPPASAILVVRVRPMARWLWWGALVMVGGGLLALGGRRPRASRLLAPLTGEESSDRVGLRR